MVCKVAALFRQNYDTISRKSQSSVSGWIIERCAEWSHQWLWGIKMTFVKYVDYKWSFPAIIKQKKNSDFLCFLLPHEKPLSIMAQGHLILCEHKKEKKKRDKRELSNSLNKLIFGKGWKQIQKLWQVRKHYLITYDNNKKIRVLRKIMKMI